MPLPLVALTLGDPTGVGPEIVVRAWREPSLWAAARPLVVGHAEIVRRAAERFAPGLTVTAIDHPRQARPDPASIPCLHVGDDAQLAALPCRIDARGGQAAYDAVVRAAELALSGEVDAITTGPLHKEALRAAGHDVPGHTELLARLCGVPEVAMMLYLPPGDAVRGPGGLGVVHVTLHVALREVFARLTQEAVRAKIHLAAQIMARLKGGPPRIAVCALNPHAGEGGLFGDEEQRLIEPAVRVARAEGVDAVGPLPADTLMIRARDGEFDGVVAMYHDQGHIALKLLGMHAAVNVTLGLPIVRTSVAHGTAFDLAWQGRSETRGLLAAVRVAALLASGSNLGEPRT